MTDHMRETDWASVMRDIVAELGRLATAQELLANALGTINAQGLHARLVTDDFYVTGTVEIDKSDE